MRSRTSKARGIGLTLGVASLVAAGLVAVSPNLDAAGQQGFGRGQRGSMDRGRGSAGPGNDRRYGAYSSRNCCRRAPSSPGSFGAA